MTNQKSTRPKLSLSPISAFTHRWESQPIKTLIPTLIGFDNFFDIMDKAFLGECAKAESYPPRNVIQFDESTWEVQFAVAGFKRENLKITIDGNELTVKGHIDSVEDELDSKQYLYKGIGLREFEHKITFPENATVVPTLEDGLLRIRITKPVQRAAVKELEILTN